MCAEQIGGKFGHILLLARGEIDGRGDDAAVQSAVEGVEYLLVDGIAEKQAVAFQIVDDERCYGGDVGHDIAVLVFVLKLNGVAAMGEQQLDKFLLLIESGRHRWGWLYRLLRSLRLVLTRHKRLLGRVESELLAVLGAQNLVKLVHQGLLGHLQSAAALLDVGGAVDGVRNDGYGLDNVLDDAGLFDRVVLGVLQQKVGLETDEILGVVGQILGDILDRIVLYKGVGVVFRRQHHYAHIHAFFQKHVGAA